MIVSDEEKDKAILAGKIAAKTIIYGRSLIKPDEKVVDVLDKIESFIVDNGGNMAFPAQISINETAAHYCPEHDDPKLFKDSDMIKLDLGVHIDGIIADNAITVVFREHEKFKELMDIKIASEEALANALKMMIPGTRLGDIGLMIQETIAKYDLSPIRNLSGHGLGKYSVHEHPTIPNFNTGDDTELKENQLVAVEPFATNGHGMIYESSNSTLFAMHSNKPVRNQMTREILADIKKFSNLPFTTRWLTKKHSPAKVRFALNELRNIGVIHPYPPLIEVNKGVVSQSEHTVIIGDKPLITTLRDED